MRPLRREPDTYPANLTNPDSDQLSPTLHLEGDVTSAAANEGYDFPPGSHEAGPDGYWKPAAEDASWDPNTPAEEWVPQPPVMHHPTDPDRPDAGEWAPEAPLSADWSPEPVADEWAPGQHAATVSESEWSGERGEGWSPDAGEWAPEGAHRGQAEWTPESDQDTAQAEWAPDQDTAQAEWTPDGVGEQEWAPETHDQDTTQAEWTPEGAGEQEWAPEHGETGEAEWAPEAPPAPVAEGPGDDQGEPESAASTGEERPRGKRAATAAEPSRTAIPDREMTDDVVAYWDMWSGQIGQLAYPTLERLKAQLPQLTAAMLCTADGFNLCSLGVEEHKVSRLSALTSSLYSVSSAASGVVHSENPRDNEKPLESVQLANGTSQTIIISVKDLPVGDLLLWITAEKAKLGVLLVRAHATATDLRRLLSTQ